MPSRLVDNIFCDGGRGAGGSTASHVRQLNPDGTIGRHHTSPRTNSLPAQPSTLPPSPYEPTITHRYLPSQPWSQILKLVLAMVSNDIFLALLMTKKSFRRRRLGPTMNWHCKRIAGRRRYRSRTQRLRLRDLRSMNVSGYTWIGHMTRPMLPPIHACSLPLSAANVDTVRCKILSLRMPKAWRLGLKSPLA